MPKNGHPEAFCGFGCLGEAVDRLGATWRPIIGRRTLRGPRRGAVHGGACGCLGKRAWQVGRWRGRRARGCGRGRVSAGHVAPVIRGHHPPALTGAGHAAALECACTRYPVFGTRVKRRAFRALVGREWGLRFVRPNLSGARFLGPKVVWAHFRAGPINRPPL